MMPTARLELDAEVVGQQGREFPEMLSVLLRQLVAGMPLPLHTPTNARHRAGERLPRFGHHGGYRMTGDKVVKVGSRMILEVLAGRMSVEEMNTLRGWDSNPFERMLSNGRLPVNIDVIPEQSDNDDWIKYEFGDPDPAISDFL
jgi:hypothetical protein